MSIIALRTSEPSVVHPLSASPLAKVCIFSPRLVDFFFLFFFYSMGGATAWVGGGGRAEERVMV
jgi:hypothetical protein